MIERSIEDQQLTVADDQEPSRATTARHPGQQSGDAIRLPKQGLIEVDADGDACVWPELGPALDRVKVDTVSLPIALGLLWMMYPVLAKVRYGELGHLTARGKLLGLLDRLVDSGKSVIVIEHHQAVMAHADWIIDLGPGAGHEGGRIVFEGTPAELVAARSTLTGEHLAAYVRR